MDGFRTHPYGKRIAKFTFYTSPYGKSIILNVNRDVQKEPFRNSHHRTLKKHKIEKLFHKPPVEGKDARNSHVLHTYY